MYVQCTCTCIYIVPVHVHVIIPSFILFQQKQESSEDRKFQRGLKERQDQDMKQFLSQQKSDYRATKALFKKVRNLL